MYKTIDLRLKNHKQTKKKKTNEFNNFPLKSVKRPNSNRKKKLKTFSCE